VFIPVAERALMIEVRSQLCGFVRSCEDLADLPDVSLAVNLSANQIRDAGSEAELLDILVPNRDRIPGGSCSKLTRKPSLRQKCSGLPAKISALQDAGFRDCAR